MRDTVKETNKSEMGAKLGGGRGLSTLNLAGLIRRAAAEALEKPPWLRAQTDPATGARGARGVGGFGPRFKTGVRER